MFRGLPLTSEQNSEIRHYIHCRQRSNLPWDTPELHAMLADMLDPPEVDAEDPQALSGSIGKERAAADLDDGETEREDDEHRPGA
jgi:hypothetical protein